MKISLPTTLTLLGTNVIDDSVRLKDIVDANGNSVTFTKGFEITDGTDVYAYAKETDFTPATFDPTNDKYKIGDIVVYGTPKRLYRISAKTGVGQHIGKAPKQPEEYGAYDTDIDWTKWSNRYFRIPYKVTTGAQNDFISKQFHFGGRWYYVFFEDRSHHADCGWRWSAKDLSATGKRNASHYLRTCLSGKTSNAFDFSKDAPAKIITWGSSGRPKVPTLQFQSLIIRGDYFYFRTNVNAPVEYKDATIGSTVKYALDEVKSPTDIDGFEYKRKVCPLSPFDNKNYTSCKQSPTDEETVYMVQNIGKMDCIAFGRIIADSVSIMVTDEQGRVKFSIDNYPIDNELGVTGLTYPVTSIIYFNQILEDEHKIIITLHGATNEVGTIIGGLTLDAGMTNTLFENAYEDYSPMSKDKWGNVEYINGVRVHTYKGTVDMPTKDYDRINRILISIGGQNVIINGSDSVDNAPTDSIQIFSATMFIGRFKTLRQKTLNVGNRLDHTATYGFEFNEGV